MIFTSFSFFIFLPAVLLVYFLIPRKMRTGWLLLASLGFYLNFHPKYLLVIAFSTVVSYLAGRRLETLNGQQENGARGGMADGDVAAGNGSVDDGVAIAAGNGSVDDGVVIAAKKRRTVLILGIVIVTAVLVFFKYTNFLLGNVNKLLGLAGVDYSVQPLSLVLPVGLSYYTFQVISYIADVYHGKISAEKNFLHYALYVSFFPKVISGPIERAGDFLKQVKECHNFNLWNAKQVRDGIVLMLWGYFQKMVIADRLAILTGQVMDHFEVYGMVELFVAMCAYCIQMFADFAGYTDAVIGMSQIMGFSIRENFNAPMMARSIRDYWARWHISLSSWLRDYIYIPLGGNRKGKVRKYINIMITFVLSGLWHGASWHYVFWGAFHGMYQVLEYLIRPVVDKVNAALHTKTESFSYGFLRTVKTWFLVAFAFIFFKLPSAVDGFRYIGRMFTRWNPWAMFDGTLYTLGISEKYFHLMIWFILILFVVEWMRYQKEVKLDVWLAGQCVWFRYGVMIALLLCIIVFGAYGPAYDAANFVYFQF